MGGETADQGESGVRYRRAVGRSPTLARDLFIVHEHTTCTSIRIVAYSTFKHACINAHIYYDIHVL